MKTQHLVYTNEKSGYLKNNTVRSGQQTVGPFVAPLVWDQT